MPERVVGYKEVTIKVTDHNGRKRRQIVFRPYKENLGPKLYTSLEAGWYNIPASGDTYTHNENQRISRAKHQNKDRKAS